MDITEEAPSENNLATANAKGAKSLKPKEEKSELRAIWLKERTWEKLQIVKAGLNLTWNEVMEIFCMHALQSGLIDAENEKALLGLQDEGFQWRESYALGGPWSNSKSVIEEISEETKKINYGLEDLIGVLEDHAEVILMGNIPIEGEGDEDDIEGDIEEDIEEDIDKKEDRGG